MPKALTRPALAFLAACALAQAAAAQTTLEWVALAPAGEAFTARVPKEPLTLVEPAQKDGRAVSQYVVLEYNFNIY